VRVGQRQHYASLSRDVQPMHPHAGVQYPACGRGLETLAFVVWQRRPVLVERAADAGLYGRRDEHTAGQHHPQGHEACGVFARARRGQTLGGCADAKAARGRRRPGVSGQPLWRGPRGLVECVRREAERTGLVDTRLTGRAPRRQGSANRGDALGRRGARAWTPPLPLRGGGAAGAVVETRGRPVVGTRRQGLVGLCGTGTGGAAQPLERLDCAVTRPAPLRSDGALGLGWAMCRVQKAPAVRHTAVSRGLDCLAIALCPRGPALRRRWGEDLLGVGQGRGDAGAPRAAGLGALWPIVGAREGTVGHARGGGARGVQRRQVVADALAARCALMPRPTQGLPQHRETGVVLPHARHHPLVQGGPMSSPRAVGDGHTLCVRSLLAVRAAITLATRRSELAARGRQPHTGGGRGGTEARECRPPKVVEGIAGAPAGVSMARAGLHAGGHEARERLRLQKMGDQGARLVDQAEAMEPQGLDGMAGGHHPHGRIWRRRLRNHLRAAERFQHARHSTHVLSNRCAVRVRRGREVRAVRVSPRLRLGREIGAAPKNDAMTQAWCGIADQVLLDFLALRYEEKALLCHFHLLQPSPAAVPRAGGDVSIHLETEVLQNQLLYVE